MHFSSYKKGNRSKCKEVGVHVHKYCKTRNIFLQKHKKSKNIRTEQLTLVKKNSNTDFMAHIQQRKNLNLLTKH